MYGLVFAELKKYAEDRFGEGTWPELLHAAGVDRSVYLNVNEYPDEEAVALLTAAAKRAEQPAAEMQEDFGRFVMADLVQVYGPMIKPEWNTLDLIVNTEAMIHELIRRKNPEAKPPTLGCSRESADAVLISYSSPRRMCGFAKGLVHGVAEHYGEQIDVTESSCMERGDPTCSIWVTTEAGSA
jgi:hypothetical protein